jgi:hypothetical protein
MNTEQFQAESVLASIRLEYENFDALYTHLGSMYERYDGGFLAGKNLYIQVSLHHVHEDQVLLGVRRDPHAIVRPLLARLTVRVSGLG